MTALGTAGQVGLGLLGVDLPLDVRDLTYDLTHWDWSGKHIAQTLLDAIGLIPGIGILKNVDEVAAIIKNAAKNSDEVAALIRGVCKSSDEAAALIGTIAENSDEAMDLIDGVAKNADEAEEILEGVLKNADEAANAAQTSGKAAASVVEGAWKTGKKIVIGESMKRVMPYAEKIGAEVYAGFKYYDKTKAMFGKKDGELYWRSRQCIMAH